MRSWISLTGATDCLVSTVNIGILFSSHVVLVLLLLITKQIQCIMYIYISADFGKCYNKTDTGYYDMKDGDHYGL